MGSYSRSRYNLLRLFPKYLAARLCISAVLGFSAIWTLLALPSNAHAQIALSFGAQEIYDDNIYLEDDKGGFSDSALSEINQLPQEERDEILNLPENQDGDPNSDFITFLNFGVASPVSISRHLQSGTDAVFGVLMFGSETEQNRFTVDATTRVESESTIIPDPFLIAVQSQFSSGASSISVADGTSARQTQSHSFIADAGIGSYQIADKTDFSALYTFERKDFMGAFFVNEENDDDIFDNDDEGSDFNRNRFGTSVNRQFTERMSAGLGAAIDYLDFTSVGTNDFGDQDTGDLDRIDWDVTASTTYQVSEKLSLSGSAGFEFTNFVDDPEDTAVTVPTPGGDNIEIIDEADDSLSSFAFSAGASYLPTVDTGINLSVGQSSGLDSGGQRLLTRTVALNASQSLGDRITAIGAGRYLQFEEGDDLGDATDRWEVSLALHYALTENTSLSAGWNYVNQDADDDVSNGLLFLADSYEGNRAFIAINSGYVGLLS